MSKFFNRIGTKAIKYSYEIHVQRVKLAIDQACNIVVMFKRGNHNVSTVRRAILNPQTGSAFFDEVLLLDATLYHETKVNRYQKKEAQLIVLIDTGKQKRSAGEVTLNLSDFPQTAIKQKDEIQKLQKCPDPNAIIAYKITCSRVGEINDSQISEEDRPEEFQFTNRQERSMSHGKDFESSLQKPVQVLQPPQKQERASSAQKQQQQLQQQPQTLDIRSTVRDSAIEKSQTPDMRPSQLKKSNPFDDDDDQQQSHIVQSSLVNSTKMESDKKPQQQPPQQQQQLLQPPQPEKFVYEKSKSPTQSSFQALRGGFASNSKPQEIQKLASAPPMTTPQRLKESIQNDDDDIIIVDDTASRNSVVIDARESTASNVYQAYQPDESAPSGINSKLILKLQATIKDLKSENENLKKQQPIQTPASGSGALAIELQKLQQKHKDSEAKAFTLEQELMKIKASTRKRDQEYTNLQNDFESLRRDHLSNQEQLASFQGEKDKVSAVNKSIDSELKKNREKIASQGIEIDKLREQIHAMGVENDRMQQLLLIAKQERERFLKEKEEFGASKQSVEALTSQQIKNRDAELIELRNQIKFALEQKEHALSAQTNMAIHIQNLKLENDKLKLTHDLNLKELQNSGDSPQILEQEKQQLIRQLEQAENEIKDLHEDMQTQSSQYQQKLDALQQRIQDLQDETKNEAQDIIQQGKFDTMRKKLEAQIKVLQKQVEFKEQKLQEQVVDLNKAQEQIFELENQIHQVKGQSMTQFEDEEPVEREQYKKKYQKLKDKLSKMEEEYMDRIDSLQKYIQQLEQQRSQSTKQGHGNNSTVDEMKLAKLSVENEKLRIKIKEYELVVNQPKEESNKKLNDEILSMKIHQTSLDKKLVQVSKELKETQDQLVSIRRDKANLEEELIQSKIQIGDIFNIVMEKGTPKLSDELTTYLQKRKNI